MFLNCFYKSDLTRINWIGRLSDAWLRGNFCCTNVLSADVHGGIHIHFNLQQHLNSRETYKRNRSSAMAAWQLLIACISATMLPTHGPATQVNYPYKAVKR